jgi:hypothetical protein
LAAGRDQDILDKAANPDKRNKGVNVA